MAEPVYVGEASGGGGRYYDPDTGMYWTAATGWYYSSGGDESSGAITPSGGGGTVIINGVAYPINGGGGDTSNRYRTITSDGSDGYPAGTIYQLDTQDGSRSNIRYPASGGGGSHVTIVNTPIQNQGGRYVTQTDTDGSVTGVPGATYQQDTYDGSITILTRPNTPVSRESYPGSGVTDQGISIYAIPSSKSPTGYMLADGRYINPDGSLYQAPPANTGRYKTVTSDGTDGFPRGTIYQLDTTDGSRSNIRYPSTSGGSSSGGGTSSAGAAPRVSSGGGSSGGGGVSTRSGGYNNTDVNTVIHQGGFNDTSFNTSEMGPNALANAAAERGLSGLQSAGGLAAKLSELMDARTNNIIQNLSNPSDIVAREYATRGLAAPDGTAQPMYGDNALLSEIINALRGGNSGGGNLGGLFGGGDVGGGGGGTGAGLPSPDTGTTPATTPATTPPPVQDAWTEKYGQPPQGYSSWPEWLSKSGNGPSWFNSVTTNKEGGQGYDINDPNLITQVGPWIQQYNMQRDPQWQANMSNYLAGQKAQTDFQQKMLGYAYRGDNPNTSTVEHDYGTQNFDPTGVTYTPSGSNIDYSKISGYLPGYGSDYYPAPKTNTVSAADAAANKAANVGAGITTQPVAPNTTTSSIGGTGVATNPTQPLPTSGYHAGDPNYRYDPSSGSYIHLAHGGMTTAKQAVVGDPQEDGKVNPEMLYNPTGAPLSVMPMKDMPMMSQMMQRIPRYAYGTEDQTDPFASFSQQAEPAAPNTTTQPAPTQPSLSDFWAGLTAKDLLSAQPAPTATYTPSQPLPNTTTEPAPTTTGYGDWRDKLPSAGETVPTTTTTPNTASTPAPVTAPTSSGTADAPIGTPAPAPIPTPTISSILAGMTPEQRAYYYQRLNNTGDASGSMPVFDLSGDTQLHNTAISPAVANYPGGQAQYIADQKHQIETIYPGGVWLADGMTYKDPAGNLYRVDPVGPMPLTGVQTPGGGLGIHPYNGKPADTIMSYGDAAYQNLPSLLYAQGRIPLSAYFASQNGMAPGAFGTEVPFAGALNYNRALNLMRIPGSYGALSSLYKSANLSLDDEIAKARARAPLGQAYATSGIET